jgi:hypothetical protein
MIILLARESVLPRKRAGAFLGCRGRFLSRFWAGAEAHWMTFSRKRALPRLN